MTRRERALRMTKEKNSRRQVGERTSFVATNKDDNTY
jgi:hypothetical protein